MHMCQKLHFVYYILCVPYGLRARTTNMHTNIVLYIEHTLSQFTSETSTSHHHMYMRRKGLKHTPPSHINAMSIFTTPWPPLAQPGKSREDLQSTVKFVCWDQECLLLVP